MPKISIIVPVYNGERFLEKSVRSILDQTERDIQLILVNDGSTDSTGVLCETLAAKDRRVMVIHQKNAGVSAARNAGLSVAIGDYIGFVDADDYIADDTYEIALAAMGDCDIVMWDTVSIWDDGRTEADTIPMLECDCVLRKEDFWPELLRYMAGSACRCLYKKTLVSDVRFPVGIKLSEDRLFNLEAMGKAEKLRYFKKGLYYRYMRPGSAVNRYHGDKFEKNLKAMSIAKEILNKYWDDRYLGIYIRMFVIEGAMAAIYEICSRDYPGKKRLPAIRRIAQSDALTKVFQVLSPEGFREKMLRNRWCFPLLLVGMAWNLKNRG